jgi:CheY-like chemotaxis protein
MRAPLRILVVEDNPDALVFFAQVLKSGGYRVDTAADGKQAVEKATSQRYDLVLSDIELPHLDGIDAARALRAFDAQEGRNPTPIVAVTAQDRRETRQAAAAAGMDAFLTKPVRRETLLLTVKQFIDATTVVLVVDDAEQNRTLISTWLATRPETRVIAVDRAGASLACVRRERVDVVLLDMVMPGIDGYAAARLLRALPEAKDIPIVAITAKVGEDEEKKCLAAGCSDYMPKPLTKPGLIALIDRLGRPLSSEPRLAAFMQSVRPPPPPPPPPPSKGAIVIELDDEAAALVPAFLENRCAELAVLDRALARAEFETLLRLGHNLRGSGGSYGFPRMSELGEQLEHAAKAQDTGAASTAIEQLKLCLQAALLARGA